MDLSILMCILFTLVYKVNRFQSANAQKRACDHSCDFFYFILFFYIIVHSDVRQKDKPSRLANLTSSYNFFHMWNYTFGINHVVSHHKPTKIQF